MVGQAGVGGKESQRGVPLGAVLAPQSPMGEELRPPFAALVPVGGEFELWLENALGGFGVGDRERLGLWRYLVGSLKWVAKAIGDTVVRAGDAPRRKWNSVGGSGGAVLEFVVRRGVVLIGDQACANKGFECTVFVASDIEGLAGACRAGRRRVCVSKTGRQGRGGGCSCGSRVWKKRRRVRYTELRGGGKRDIKPSRRRGRAGYGAGKAVG